MRFMAIFGFALGVFAPLLAPQSAHAQATRTWVSGVGDDVNPCSRTAPCKTFAGAISKTAANGEIDCLDPGGYGTLTITKSITIDCIGTLGSTLNSGGINGFIINDSATATPNTAKVTLRNLSINGAGTTLGLNGIRFIPGLSLNIENVTIENQSNAGIDIAKSANGSLTVRKFTFQKMSVGIKLATTAGNTSLRQRRQIQRLGKQRRRRRAALAGCRQRLRILRKQWHLNPGFDRHFGRVCQEQRDREQRHWNKRQCFGCQNQRQRQRHLRDLQGLQCCRRRHGPFRQQQRDRRQSG